MKSCKLLEDTHKILTCRHRFEKIDENGDDDANNYSCKICGECEHCFNDKIDGFEFGVRNAIAIHIDECSLCEDNDQPYPSCQEYKNLNMMLEDYCKKGKKNGFKN